MVGIASEELEAEPPGLLEAYALVAYGFSTRPLVVAVTEPGGKTERAGVIVDCEDAAGGAGRVGVVGRGGRGGGSFIRAAMES